MIYGSLVFLISFLLEIFFFFFFSQMYIKKVREKEEVGVISFGNVLTMKVMTLMRVSEVL